MKAEGERIRLSATDLSNHLACLHLTTLDRGVALGRLTGPSFWDPRLEVLRKRGLAHERTYIDHLREQGSEVVEMDLGLDTETASARTRSAMHAGAQVITQATLVDGGWHGRADVLRRVERPSRLGPWSYEVMDTKLAVETRAGTVLQLCVYSDLVERIQGTRPDEMHVVVPGRPFAVESLRLDHFLAYYRFVKRRLELAISVPLDDARTYPEPTPHCDVCRWWSECDRKRRNDDHLSFVAGLGRLHTRQLREQGIETLVRLAGEAIPLAWKPERGAVATYEKLREQARVQRETRGRDVPLFELLPLGTDRGLARLPEPSPGDLFLDFEGDPYVADGGLEYLLGYVALGDNAEPHYKCRWALDRTSEKTAFEGLIDEIMDRWQRDPGLHLYHYAHYEPSALKRLVGRHATREDEVDRMLRAGLFVDLHGVVRQAARVGVEEYSIKRLEPLYAFKRALPLDDAARSRRAVEIALELGETDTISAEFAADVEMYNHDDCVSALRLRDWLEGRRSELVSSGARIPRPNPATGDPSEELNEWLRRIELLAARLLDGVPADPQQRSDKEQGRWLLAQLLAWHHREEKVTWWEFFRLAELSVDDRLDEPAALSGLEFIARVGRTDKCPVHRYRFPPQEVEVRPDDAAHVSKEQELGTVVDLDPVARTVDIKKRQDSRDEHPASFFVHNRVRAGVLEDALYRLGEWVAENGIDAEGPYRAGRDVLLRVAPRGAGASGERLRRSDEPIVPAARRLALVLHGGVLPVQGPPGAGKTYAGARMIVELVRSGRKVGISANSHKVIRNLLDEVVRAARQEGANFQCIQKVDEESEVANPVIEETNANPRVLQRLVSGEARVGAGTAWLWSRDEFHEVVDVLVVDEAGQMSLANVVAISQAAKSVILIGDPCQLEQPIQATHPAGTDVSALEHLLGGHLTIPDDRGLFLEETWRLHPTICKFTSELFYENRLWSRSGLERQRIQAPAPFDHSGLFYVPVKHEGNQNSSPEEADVVARLVRTWLQQRASWIDANGAELALTLSDILIVAPYNAHVAALGERLPNARIGTVDKFQGQEAPVVIYSMATSSPEDAPRGMEFLYSGNRLNVATSRARCACVLVANPDLFEPECRTPHQMQLANALCRFLEMATVVDRLD